MSLLVELLPVLFGIPIGIWMGIAQVNAGTGRR